MTSLFRRRTLVGCSTIEPRKRYLSLVAVLSLLASCDDGRRAPGPGGGNVPSPLRDSGPPLQDADMISDGTFPSDGASIHDARAGEDAAVPAPDARVSDAAAMTCGNGLRDPGEVCEGGDLDGRTCATEGFDQGELLCTGTCVFDFSRCTRGDRSPRIVNFAANQTTMRPADTLTLSVIVSDPDGVQDVLGGTLEQPGGGTYGTFTGVSGAFSIQLTWTALNVVAPINAPPNGTSRTLRARFFDAGGHNAIAELTITLQCDGSGRSACAGSCFDLSTNHLHCGACNTPLPSGYEDCIAGVPACNSGRTYCGGQCVATDTNDDHCGGCNRPLGAGYDECRNGRPSCYSGRTDCSGTCADLDHDSQHCGMCSISCGMNSNCNQGGCVFSRSAASASENCNAICMAAGGTCRNATKSYSHRSTCTCMGIGCWEDPIPCGQAGSVVVSSCETGFLSLLCECLE